MPYMPGTNTGHGHVWERPDGVKARCGGPGMCTQCAFDLADKEKSNTTARSKDEIDIRMIRSILGLSPIHDPVAAVRVLYEGGREAFLKARGEAWNGGIHVRTPNLAEAVLADASQPVSERR